MTGKVTPLPKQAQYPRPVTQKMIDDSPMGWEMGKLVVPQAKPPGSEMMKAISLTVNYLPLEHKVPEKGFQYDIDIDMTAASKAGMKKRKDAKKSEPAPSAQRGNLLTIS